MRNQIVSSKAAGFSLMELIIAMTITLGVMVMASTLLAQAFRIRTRENQKSDALADAQRGLNIMSREIANAGFNLSSNGIVAADSNGSTIRIRSNMNKFDLTASDLSRNNVQDPGEDVKYFINVVTDTTYLARWDEFATTRETQRTVLANRVDTFNIHYFDRKVTYTAASGDTDITNPSTAEVSPGAAKYIVIALSVTLNAVGTPGSAGYQPASRVLLVSDVTLRNFGLSVY